jgi:hypothetical protein
VISPLLANIYLRWFDEVFHRSDGPAGQAGALGRRSGRVGALPRRAAGRVHRDEDRGLVGTEVES